MITFSVDAETNGLYGYSLAIAVTVRNSVGVEIDKFVGRVPDFFINDDWCIQHVKPHLESIQEYYHSPEALEEAFWQFWRKVKDALIVVEVIAHMPHPVESGLFRRCVERNLNERAFLGPMHIHDVGTLLMLGGFNSHSVDQYIEKFDLDRPTGTPHHPMYDSVAAYVVWSSLIEYNKIRKL